MQTDDSEGATFIDGLQDALNRLAAMADLNRGLRAEVEGLLDRWALTAQHAVAETRRANASEEERDRLRAEVEDRDARMAIYARHLQESIAEVERLRAALSHAVSCADNASCDRCGGIALSFLASPGAGEKVCCGDDCPCESCICHREPEVMSPPPNALTGAGEGGTTAAGGLNPPQRSSPPPKAPDEFPGPAAEAVRR